MNAVESRFHSLKTRIDNAIPRKSAHLIDRMADDFEPEAIGVLIQLFAHKDERATLAGRTLARFGEAAEGPIQAHIARADICDLERDYAASALEWLRYRVRFAEVVGH